MMRKTAAVLLTALLAGLSVCAQAGEKINLYIHRDTLLLCDLSEGRILAYPDDRLRVTRASLYPWDKDATQHTLLVEVQNISDEKIVVDEDWLYACNLSRDKQTEAAHVFDMTTSVIMPGERCVLFSGVYPYAEGKRRHSDVISDAQTIEGMADFSGYIRYARYLRVRLDTRGAESTQAYPSVPVDADVWIEDGKLCFEMTNTTQETQAFRTIGAVVSERNGRLTDVLMETYAKGAVVRPGETFRAEKDLPPYFTQEMIDGATFKIFAYQYPI